jgi:hypothetical protein
MRLVKLLALALAGVLLLAGVGVAVLFLTAPGPRDAPEWSLGPPLSEPRGELATATAHASPCPEPPCPELERLFVLGGLAGVVRTEDRVESFDPGTGTWREGPPLPAPRHHLAAAGLGEAVYVSGGAAEVSQPWAPETDFWRLPVGGAAWEALPPMPEGRWGHRMVDHGGLLYVVGGQGPSSRVLVYDPEVASWTMGAEIPVLRDHLSVVAAGDRIWAIGGRVPESLARVDIYDPETDTWESGPDLPQPTSGAAEGVVDGVILVLGGEEAALRGGGIIDRHWMLDTRLENPTWEAAPPPPLAIHGADGAVFQGTMVMVGGASRHGALSVTAWTGAFQRLEARMPPE